MSAQGPISHTAGEIAVVLRPKQPAIIQFMKRLMHKPLGFISFLIILGVVFCALFADIVAPYDPDLTDRTATLVAPNVAHPLGTDPLGRDVLSRIIYGARISLFIGILATGTNVILGATIGMIAGYYGGRLGMIIMRCMDVVMAIPLIILAIVMVGILGPSTKNVILAIIVVGTPSVARVTEGIVLSVSKNVYVDGGKAIGATDFRILFRYILPNILHVTMVQFSIGMGFNILTESSLSFLGLGSPPPTPTWGQMLSGSGRRYFALAPWLAIWPGLAITLVVYSYNMLGDALRDLLDPRMRGS
ncbi:MAG: ABC transporter permease [Dehalococcoidia bacterium]|nr:ABC transporter permease [Dehalococcoidia bacterium]